MNVFERYPQLATLRGKVPDDVVQREIAEKAPRFERYAEQARKLIPTVRLVDVFPAELEQGRIVLKNFLGQWGNITVEEVCKIALIARWLAPRRVFEFGTYNGMTTRQIALNTPNETRILTLDIDPASATAAQLEVGDVDRHLAQKRGAFDVPVGHYFRDTPEKEKIHQLWGDSLKFDPQLYAHQIDLVFVDAGHTYPYVKSDTTNALTLLRPGGVVLWHDYFQVLHPDVMRHICELAEAGRRIYHLRGTSLAVYYDSPSIPA